MATNFNIADMIARLNIASKKRLVSVKIMHTDFSLALLKVLWKNGIINGFTVNGCGTVSVFFKYYRLKPVFRQLIIISRPGKRVF
jgi:ribosomal protein S8